MVSASNVDKFRPALPGNGRYFCREWNPDLLLNQYSKPEKTGNQRTKKWTPKRKIPSLRKMKLNQEIFECSFRRKNLILLVFLVCLPFVLIKAFSGTPILQGNRQTADQKNYDPAFISSYPFSYETLVFSEYPDPAHHQQQSGRKGGGGSQLLDDTYSRYFLDDMNHCRHSSTAH
ncbi:MAG: hypothetical protein R2860_16410 [Desulfobacterales bacterium]